MHGLNESKIECTFRFVADGRKDTLSEEFNGVLHLFEHEYALGVTFWYGAAEINCSPKQFDAAWQEAGLTDLSVRVLLPDGRAGAARVVTSNVGDERETRYCRVAIFGWTPLRVRTPAPPA